MTARRLAAGPARRVIGAPPARALLAITERDLWLGAFVSLRPQGAGGAASARPSAGELGLSARTTRPGS
jgi:hypothetical protein